MVRIIYTLHTYMGVYRPRRSRYLITRIARNTHPSILRAGLQKDHRHPSSCFSRFLGGAIPLSYLADVARGKTRGWSLSRHRSGAAEVTGEARALLQQEHLRKNSRCQRIARSCQDVKMRVDGSQHCCEELRVASVAYVSEVSVNWGFLLKH
jgi:hypothetical protein